MRSIIKRGLGWAFRRWAPKLYRIGRKAQDEAAALAFIQSVPHVGTGCRVHHPFYLRSPQYLKIGTDFWAGPGLRIEAWDTYRGQTHLPDIVIGDNVVVNFCVHIGAIGRLEIGNDVLIGSYVLITDHSHGHLTPEDLDTPAFRRPLVSKGPVVIEDNVWIGEGACILSGVRIGRNAVIGANAVVTRDVVPGQIVGGVPARSLASLARHE